MRESRLVPPFDLSAKAQRMEHDGWAASLGGSKGVGGREVLTNTEVLTRDRGPHRVKGPLYLSFECEDLTPHTSGINVRQRELMVLVPMRGQKPQPTFSFVRTSFVRT